MRNLDPVTITYAELEDLQVDAERYRWLNANYDLLLRIGMKHGDEYQGRPVALKCGPELDRWIDEKIAKEQRAPQDSAPK